MAAAAPKLRESDLGKARKNFAPSLFPPSIRARVPLEPLRREDAQPMARGVPGEAGRTSTSTIWQMSAAAAPRAEA